MKYLLKALTPIALLVVVTATAQAMPLGMRTALWGRPTATNADDAMPDLGISPSDAVVSCIMTDVADVSLTAKVTNAEQYAAYRMWVLSITNGTTTTRSIKLCPHAWLSYALDAAALMAKATPIGSEDVKIESIAPSDEMSGAFDLVVNIADVQIGTSARLAEVFDVEGATELNEAAFSSNGLSVTLQRTDGGKAKATIMPDGAPPAFFLRVNVK